MTNQDHRKTPDIPAVAGICFVVSIIAIVVALLMESPWWLLAALAGALGAVALWIRAGR